MSSTLSSFKPQRHGHIQDNGQALAQVQAQVQVQVQQPKPANYYALELFPLTAESEKHYRKLFGNGIVNDRADDNAGVDLYTMSVEDKGAAKVVHTGVAAKLIDVDTGKPVHYYLAPRSSIWKSGVTMANSMGIIDSSYRGELMGACIPIVSVGEEGELVTAVDIKEGDRLFQVLAPGMGWIRKVVVLSKSELDTTSRGAGGFGSTGK
jgi:dUTP pyrophosphatase